MALCRFSDNFHILDVTPIENLFIHEFMVKAPGDFVKVYLYGLKQCYHPNDCENTIDSFAQALELEPKVIENALSYWNRQGILTSEKNEKGHLTVIYHNIKDVLSSNSNNEVDMYKYKDFNYSLQRIFKTRALTPQDYLRVYDWIEVLNLPMEVVLMMVQFYINKMGSKVSINYLSKVAETWAKDNINTISKAEEYIAGSEHYFKDTTAVLKYLGIYRCPSRAEIELYKKWSKQWGFNLQAILTACKETTKIQSPNLSYLDKILENLHSLGIKLPQEINDYFDSRNTINSSVKSIYHHLGYKEGAPTPAHIDMYKKWVDDYNLEDEVIILACKHSVKKGRTSFEKLDNLLRTWVKNGLTSVNDIKEFLLKRKAIDSNLSAIFERAGVEKNISQADRKLYKTWTQEYNFSLELILLAAEYSIMADNKLPFMNKILKNWYDSNISTIEEARADNERHKKAMDLLKESGKNIKGNKAKGKELDFNKFQQHSYSEEDLEFLFENFETN